MRISFNDLFIAKILMSKQSKACQYIVDRFLLYSLPLIFKNKDFKSLFIEEAINNAIKEDLEISSKLITNLEILLENKIDDLINMFETISIDELEKNLEFEIKKLFEISQILKSE